MADDQPPITVRLVINLQAPPPATPAAKKTAGDAPGALDFAALSPAMREVLAWAARAAPHDDVPVLITGEAGVGKARLARWIHAHSTRADQPLVRVDCRAFSDMPTDHYLVDHPRGPFSGVGHGIFNMARGATLFLDDIADLSHAAQWHLARLVEELLHGGRRRLDVRLIAATTRNLRFNMAQRRFREDLFYCLHCWEVHIPPLRERPDDLRVLAPVLLERAVARGHRPIRGFTVQALVHLYGCQWPGNVRELKEAIEDACARATGAEIQLEDLPDTVRQGGVAMPSLGTGPSRACRSLDDVLTGNTHACIEGRRRRQGQRRLAADVGISLSRFNRRLRRLGDD
jgi:two-component system response regulator HydG